MYQQCVRHGDCRTQHKVLCTIHGRHGRDSRRQGSRAHTGRLYVNLLGGRAPNETAGRDADYWRFCECGVTVTKIGRLRSCGLQSLGLPRRHGDQNGDFDISQLRLGASVPGVDGNRSRCIGLQRLARCMFRVWIQFGSRALRRREPIRQHSTFPSRPTGIYTCIAVQKRSR